MGARNVRERSRLVRLVGSRFSPPFTRRCGAMVRAWRCHRPSQASPFCVHQSCRRCWWRSVDEGVAATPHAGPHEWRRRANAGTARAPLLEADGCPWPRRARGVGRGHTNGDDANAGLARPRELRTLHGGARCREAHVERASRAGTAPRPRRSRRWHTRARRPRRRSCSH